MFYFWTQAVQLIIKPHKGSFLVLNIVHLFGHDPSLAIMLIIASAHMTLEGLNEIPHEYTVLLLIYMYM